MTDNLQHQVVADLRARITELEAELEATQKQFLQVIDSYDPSAVARAAIAGSQLAGKTQFCQQCEMTERALLKLCGPAHVFLDGEVFPSAMKSLGLWREPTPATPTEGDQP